MRKILAATLALAILAPVTARADAYVMLGFGTQKCGEYRASDLTDPATRVGLYSWVAGYLSAVNLFTGTAQHRIHDLSGMSQELVFDTLNSFCAAQPDQVLSVGVDEILKKLPEKPYGQTKP